MRPAVRDDVWDALVAWFGEPAPSYRSLRNRHARDIKAMGGTGQDVHERAMRWPLHFPGATLTDNALVKYWGLLERDPLRVPRATVEKMQARNALREWARQEQAKAPPR
jgi:hypothetical protein